jgi:putative hydrolase of the HAD superfamily
VIAHISFDVWLTLIYTDPAFKPARDALILEYFEVEKDIKTVTETFRRYDKHFTKVNEITGQNLDSREMLLIILADLGVEIEKLNHSILDHYEEKFVDLFWQYPPILIEPNFHAIAEKLANKNISLSILSNTGFIKGKILRELFAYRKIDQFFAFQCYSDEVGLSKPSPLFYEYAFHNILIHKSLDKKQVLHVGDNPVADVNGADHFGFHSALYERKKISLEKLLIENGIF